MIGVSVIIPSGDTSRSDNLQGLLRDLEQQSTPPLEIEVVRGVSPNGKARNEGASKTRGDIVIFLDDDVRLGGLDILESFVTRLRQNPSLGMLGTSQLLPPDSSDFQRRCAMQTSRSQSEVVAELTDSDMVTTQCCAMRREVFDQVGRFHDRIIRGVDPEMRHRVRRAGFRVAVIPRAWHYHPMPATLSALCRMAWRNGHASCYARRHFPETVIFNPEGHVSDFEAHPSLLRRVARNLADLLGRLGRGQWYGVLYDLMYIGGYLSGTGR